jgi:hypothetical protein
MIEGADESKAGLRDLNAKFIIGASPAAGN